MANMTDYLEGQLVAHLFRTATYTKPTVLAIALSTSNTLDDTATGASMSEVTNANSYARQTLNPLDANWAAIAGNNGTTSNTPAITFPTASGSWGNVQAVVITDNATHGAGNALFYGNLSVAKTVTNGDTFSFAANALTIQLDN